MISLFSNYFITNKWGEIYKNYCEYIKSNSVMLSADELGCLAKRWCVQLKVQFKQGKKAYSTYDNIDTNLLHVTLCNPTQIHWQVVVDDEDSKLKVEMSNQISISKSNIPSLIWQIENSDWRNAIIVAMQNSEAYHSSFRMEDCSYIVGVTSAIMDYPKDRLKQSNITLSDRDNILLKNLTDQFLETANDNFAYI